MAAPDRIAEAQQQSGRAAELGADLTYWFGLIVEDSAADFLHLHKRTMQGFRQRGGGPRYVLVSSRCVRYRRIDLREWAEAKFRTSTRE